MRPANFPKGSPGRGHTVVEANGLRLGVINLSGQVFLEAVRSPFAEVDALLSELRGTADAVLVDMHAEVDQREGRARLVPRRARDSPASGPTPTCRPRTRACCPAGPPTSPTSG